MDAESWSVGGRADLKVTSGEHRACIELKVWGRNDYLDVIGQVCGYALTSDDAAFVVMLDRSARPLVPEYRARLIDDQSHRVVGQADNGVMMPQLTTEHSRPGTDPLRVHHFLLQLTSD